MSPQTFPQIDQDLGYLVFERKQATIELATIDIEVYNKQSVLRQD